MYDSYMPSNVNKDPRLAPIQVTFRIPWAYKTQLDRVAFEQGVSVPNLVVDCLEDAYPPEPLTAAAS